MGPESSIRGATRADAAAIAALHAESWRTTYRGAMRDDYLDRDVDGERRAIWEARLGAPPANQRVFVAEEAGRVVGFACAYADADPVWGTELDNLHVRRREQGRGTGAALVAAVARWTRAVAPTLGLYLWVLDGNESARRFYEGLAGRDTEGDHWHTPDGSALAVRRYVWPPPAVARLAAGADVALAPATTAVDFASARTLIGEYAAWLQEDLCFQGFTAELDGLAVVYGPPGGVLLLARAAGVPVACVGVRRLDADTAEMKRLFVRAEARGLGVGARLARAAVDAARRLGYRRMVLDTLERMHEARRLYGRLGFTETEPYYANPLPSVRYMARDL